MQAMGWTQSELENYQRLTGHRHPCAGPRTSVQEQEDNSRWKQIDNGTKMQKMDGSSDKQYHLSVEILVSDKRRRDLDGALATICDCIVTARRRLEVYTGDKRESKSGKKG
jgi:hypothetical protein